MKNNKKMYVLYLNKEGFIDFDFGEFEECSLQSFAVDYDFFKFSTGYEIDTTNNGNVYIKRINSSNFKIDYVLLYVLKDISMKELKEDIKEIRTELNYRNEEE